MIINSTTTLKKYIGINKSIQIQNLTPYIKKAERTFLKPYIGKEQLISFETTSTDIIIVEGQELAQEAVANFAYYLYLPLNAVQITDSGIHVVDSENTKTASDKQFKELQRAFKKSAHEALDALLELMEENTAKFQIWRDSNYYTTHNELLVNKTSIFNTYYHIFNSRQTFVAMRPTIKIVEDQFIISVIGENLLTELKNTQEDSNRIAVKKLIQQAIVSFTVMKIVNDGMYIIDAKGMHMRFDQLPYEKTMSSISLKNNNFLINTKDSKRKEGSEYLKLSLKIIENNTETFSEYTAKSIPKHINVITTKSIIGI